MRSRRRTASAAILCLCPGFQVPAAAQIPPAQDPLAQMQARAAGVDRVWTEKFTMPASWSECATRLELRAIHRRSYYVPQTP